MKINTSDLAVIATRRSQYPNLELPEFLLVGRSNVGKSSFINTVLGRKDLARVSSTPGKTQTLNFYLVNNSEIISYTSFFPIFLGAENISNLSLSIIFKLSLTTLLFLS